MAARPAATADPAAAVTASATKSPEGRAAGRRAVAHGLIVLDSRYQGSAHCAVCGSEVPAGEGITVLLGHRLVRLRCGGCLSRFEADPGRYLAGHPADCCAQDAASSPASEWCD